MRADFRLHDGVSVLRVVDLQGRVRWSRRAEEVGTRLPDASRLLQAPPQGATDAAHGEYVRPLGGAVCARCHAGDAVQVGAVHVWAVQAVIARPRIEADLVGFYRGVLYFVGAVLGLLLLSSFGLLHLFIGRPLRRLTEACSAPSRATSWCAPGWSRPTRSAGWPRPSTAWSRASPR
jgi:hypothetical protein